MLVRNDGYTYHPISVLISQYLLILLMIDTFTANVSNLSILKVSYEIAQHRECALNYSTYVTNILIPYHCISFSKHFTV